MLQAALDEKSREAGEIERDLREVKTSLRERDRDIERANHALLSAEESIDVSVEHLGSCPRKRELVLPETALR